MDSDKRQSSDTGLVFPLLVRVAIFWLYLNSIFYFYKFIQSIWSEDRTIELGALIAGGIVLLLATGLKRKSNVARLFVIFFLGIRIATDLRALQLYFFGTLHYSVTIVGFVDTLSNSSISVLLCIFMAIDIISIVSLLVPQTHRLFSKELTGASKPKQENHEV